MWWAWSFVEIAFHIRELLSSWLGRNSVSWEFTNRMVVEIQVLFLESSFCCANWYTVENQKLMTSSTTIDVIHWPLNQPLEKTCHKHPRMRRDTASARPSRRWKQVSGSPFSSPVCFFPWIDIADMRPSSLSRKKVVNDIIQHVCWSCFVQNHHVRFWVQCWTDRSPIEVAVCPRWICRRIMGLECRWAIGTSKTLDSLVSMIHMSKQKLRPIYSSIVPLRDRGKWWEN